MTAEAVLAKNARDPIEWLEARGSEMAALSPAVVNLLAFGEPTIYGSPVRQIEAIEVEVEAVAA